MHAPATAKFGILIKQKQKLLIDWCVTIFSVFFLFLFFLFLFFLLYIVVADTIIDQNKKKPITRFGNIFH